MVGMTISTDLAQSMRRCGSLPTSRLLARRPALAAVVILMPRDAFAATGLDGAAMSWPYALPFAGLLLSIALGPLLFPKFWHHHYGKIAAAWSTLALVSLAWLAGGVAMLAALAHAMIAEYLGFIVLLFSLYVVAGGILVTGDMKGAPWTNTAILALGTVMASVVGTTGAAMILARPLIRANLARRHNAHVVIFFIILVANVGGALSPLGDPPLFVGFLHGVDFFWTTANIWLQTAIVSTLLLAAFVVVDVVLYRAEPVAGLPKGGTKPIRVRGLVNVLLIVAIIASLLLSAVWKSGIVFDILGTKLELQSLVRNAVLLLIAALSVWLTPDEHREANGFTWEPIREVAKLFAGIFVAIIPVIAMLNAGRHGAFAWLLSAVTEPNGMPREVAYFWFTGLMSAFLDNAPTYLLFFELAGGDPHVLMNELSGTLASISMGAVYMGALTYIGNAPNFMVRSIAIESGIEMPSFFGYLLWAGGVLIPLFLLLTVLPVAPLLSWH
jgi:Na+/H+ antiporter NhaD/arsenite permease-like protein